MGKVKYTGPDDARILDASDIAKAVEIDGFRKTTYPKGEVVEMDDAVIDAITQVPEIFGNFERVEEDAKDEAPASAKKSKASEGEVTESGSASTSTTPTTRPSGRASTGA